ncbi:hypothetical protein TELCIR_18758, partial [Teladorsagia circumcincta]
MELCFQYNLIPRASQSLKAFQDIPMLVIFLYQHHKAGVQTEAMEFLLCCLDFLGIQISNEQKADEKYNKALADEFYTAQSKMLAYLSIMGKIREFMEQILANGDRFINGVLSLLEQCPAELIVVRKDVLITLKFFFISDLRPKFIQLLPRLLSEVALIGSGYTAVDHLRGYFYQTMADFLHHVRASLSFEMLAHVAFIFCREMHDNLLPYQIQVICARMLSSVLEGLSKHAKEGEANRDLILMILESLVVKMKVIAVYHMPLLFKQHGAEINYDYKSCDRDGSNTADDDKSSDDVIREEVRRCSIDTAPEMEIGPAESPPLVRERDIFERMFKYCVQCLDVYMIPFPQPPSRVQVPNSVPGGTRSKEEKDALDALAYLFTMLNLDVFGEIFTKYMDFFVNLKSHPKGDQPPFTIRVAFDRPNTSQTFFSTIYGDLALTEIVRTALKQMRLDPSHQHYSVQVRLYAMELARSVLLSSFAPLDFSEKWEVGLKDRFIEQFKTLAMLNTCAGVLGISLSSLLCAYREVFVAQI